MLNNNNSFKLNSETCFLSLVVIIHVCLRAKSIFLDLHPFSFFDEGMYAHNVYWMYWEDKIIPPPNSLAGGFTYYICWLLTEFYNLVSSEKVALNESHILSRFVVIFISGLMPVFIYKTLKILGASGGVAILAAFISTFAPTSLALTRVVYPDHFMPGLIAVLVYCLIKFVKSVGCLKCLISSGVFLGFILSTKYSGFILCAPIGILIFHSNWGKNGDFLSDFKQTIRQSLVLFGVSAVVFLALNVDGILAGDVLRAIKSHRAHYMEGHLGAQSDHALLFYTQYLFLLSFGFLGAPLILGGLALLWSKDKIVFLFFLLMLALYLMVLGHYVVVFNRNMSLLLPVVFILIGLSMETCRRWLTKYSFYKLAVLLVVLVVSEPLVRSAIQLEFDYRDDARSVAKEWIEANIGLQYKIGTPHSVWGAPYGNLVNKIIIPLGTDFKQAPKVDYYVADGWQADFLMGGVSMFDFIPFTEHHFVNISRSEYPGLVNAHKKFLEHFDLVKTFSNKNYYGPSVYIYKAKNFNYNKNNILTNSDFEQLNLEGWTQRAQSGSATFEQMTFMSESTPFYDRPQYFARWKLRAPATFAFIEQKVDIKVLEGKKFRLSFWARSLTGKREFFSHSYFLPQGELDNTSMLFYPINNLSFTLDKQWRKVSLSYAAPNLEGIELSDNAHAIVRPIFFDDTDTPTIDIARVRLVVE